MPDTYSPFVKFTYTVLDLDGCPQKKSWMLNLSYIVSVESGYSNEASATPEPYEAPIPEDLTPTGAFLKQSPPAVAIIILCNVDNNLSPFSTIISLFPFTV